MRLLILTQKVDIHDPVLGFFHRWIEEFAKHARQVTVIALGVGEYHLPQNVRVFSLGKPAQGWSASDGERFFSRFKYSVRFYHLIWRERKNYDAVFVHMNPEYVILGGFLWRLWGKKIALWYTHKSVDLKLRLAEKFADDIFTASKESFRLPSKKVMVMGHGIDTNLFSGARKREKKEGAQISILHVGRITSIKNLEAVVEALNILKNDQKVDARAVFVGAPVTESDKEYLKKLQKSVNDRNLSTVVSFVGAVSHDRVPSYYASADIVVNLSDTGSIDKAVLEGMASGVHVLTSNEAFKNILPQHCMVSKNPKEIAKRIVLLAHRTPELALRDYVAGRHSLPRLVDLIVKIYE
ncbi:MAG: hypothetical protein A2675_00210 [Candidatus Yonathbacteria bacterium RIFCSPHIGHO2_01_FULL_51_10]|uniref:Glycosyl transferase family 1 domain-containing protein n=1 Tax=Candidatus Yonathbacteria bacterium RIFCSPHIGHO2_01_FULL_51_10 TaxID=1802723 RepID=A0A1G2SBJ2_9BACT|nr:MAG: hypothetical protein A2675_00210 [Candidatus Yonathbacteria bacterium RIFCSPHIGHO2_01_FULL_51_10]